MRQDERTLRKVARMIGDQYRREGTTENLRIVYDRLSPRLRLQAGEVELTGLFGLLAVVVTAAGLSTVWLGRFA
jgi:Ca-activated chloride channel homolog